MESNQPIQHTPQKMETLLLKEELLQKIADDHFRTASLYAQQAEDARNELIKLKQEETKRTRPESFLEELEDHAIEFWIEYNHVAGKPGYETREEWTSDEEWFDGQINVGVHEDTERIKYESEDEEYDADKDNEHGDVWFECERENNSHEEIDDIVEEKIIHGTTYKINTQTGVWYNTLSGDTVIDPNRQEFEYDWCYGHDDNYETLPSGTPISKVIEKCIELKSRAFVTDKQKKNTYYIRTPPGIKPRAIRDYKGMKMILEEKRTNGKVHHMKKVRTFILNY